MRTKSLTKWEYVLEEDRELPENEQTVHVFRHLTFEENTMLDQMIEHERNATAAGLLLQATYVGHRNLMDAEGNPVDVRTQSRSPFGKKVTTIADSTLDALTNKQRNELVQAVLIATKLSEDDAKN